MRNKILHITTWLVVFLVGAQHIFSQNTVSVKATLNRKKILIGEPVQVLLEVKAPVGTDITWFQEDSLPHFDFIVKGKIDSGFADNGRLFRQNVTITSFDSGTWVFPPLSFQVNGTSYLTDSAIVEVRYAKFNPGEDYHDIKDIVDIPNPLAKYFAWVVAVVTALCIAGLVFFIRMDESEKKQVKVVVPRLSPYEEAIKLLSELKAQNLSRDGQVKQFYTRLNDILRQFVLRKLQIASLVKTNEELILQLKQLDISNEQFAQLAQALRISDFVKFAKYQPEEEDNDRNFSIIRSSVELLNTIEK